MNKHEVCLIEFLVASQGLQDEAIETLKSHKDWTNFHVRSTLSSNCTLVRTCRKQSSKWVHVAEFLTLSYKLKQNKITINTNQKQSGDPIWVTWHLTNHMTTNTKLPHGIPENILFISSRSTFFLLQIINTNVDKDTTLWTVEIREYVTLPSRISMYWQHSLLKRSPESFLENDGCFVLHCKFVNWGLKINPFP